MPRYAKATQSTIDELVDADFRATELRPEWVARYFIRNGRLYFVWKDGE